jgi:hypothetical protein
VSYATGARAIAPTRDLAEKLYHLQGEPDAIIQELGRAGGMAWGNGRRICAGHQRRAQPKITLNVFILLTLSCAPPEQPTRQISGPTCGR